MPVEHIRRLHLSLDEKTMDTLKRWAVRTGKTVREVALDAIKDVCEHIEVDERKADWN